MEQREIEPGMYLSHGGRLCEVIGVYNGSTVAILRVLKPEDKNKCPQCDSPQETRIHEAVGCRNWNDAVEPVKTLLTNTPTE